MRPPLLRQQVLHRDGHEVSPRQESKRMGLKVQDRVRVILAIAKKDLVDAIKNKSILSQVFTVAFLIVFYRFLPAFENRDELPRLALYDAGNSVLVTTLEQSTTIKLVEFSTQEGMQAYIEDEDVVILGLVLPAGLDRQIGSGESVELEGYLIHWASDQEARETTEFFETELEKITSLPIQIHTEGNVVYSIPNSTGRSFLGSLIAVLALIVAGAFIVPILVLEEKQDKTLEALLVSPADPNTIVLAKALSGSIYCAIAIAAVLALNHTLVANWTLAIFTALIGILFSTSVGLFLGSIFEVKQQLTLWGFMLINLLGIPMFLSMMVDIIPAGIMAVINFIPTVALMRIFQASFSKGISLNVIGLELIIVLGATLIVFGVVTWVVRRSNQ
jgi:ABC-2 type transport system permease protein